MFKIILCLVVLATTLADDFNDRFDDSKEIHFVAASPTLKAVAGVPLPYFSNTGPETKTYGNNNPSVRTASDVEVVHSDQQVDTNVQPTNEGTGYGHQGTMKNIHAPFFVKVDDDDDDDDDHKVYFRKPAVAAVPLTYSAGSYRFKFDDDDDDDRKYFFRSVGVPLPYSAGYRYVDDDDRKVVFKSVGNVGAPTKYSYSVGYKYDDDDQDNWGRFFFRRAGHPSPLTYSARYRYDDDHDDVFDFDDK